MSRHRPIPQSPSWSVVPIGSPSGRPYFVGQVPWHFAISDQASLGSRSRASEVLNRRRALTVEMIRTISEAWKIPADLLVKPSLVAGAACACVCGDSATIPLCAPQ